MRARRLHRGRARRWLGALALLAPPVLLAPALASAAASAESRGTIVGKVTDSNSKEPAENALVVLTCTCLAGEREAYTNAQGYYRFKDLPPGVYSADIFVGKGHARKIIELARGQTMTANARVDSGGQLVLDYHIKPPVEMSGDTGIKVSGKELEQTTVTGADRNAIAGAIELTSTGGQDKGGPTTGGVGSGEMDYRLNGLRINDTGSGQLAMPLINEFIESVEVQESGYSAEFGSAAGGRVSARRLSGTNKLRGTARFTFTPRLARPRIITATDNAVRAQENFDYGMQGVIAMAGPLVQDRLFWSFGIGALGTKSTLNQTFWHRVDKDGSGGFEACPYQNGENDCADGKSYIATRRFADQRFPTGSVGGRAFAGIDWSVNERHRIALTASTTPAFLRRSYRRPVTSFDPDSLGASPNADPVGGASTIANGIVNDQFGWDRGNAVGGVFEYKGRVHKDKIEIDATAGYFRSIFDEAWRLDDPNGYRRTATQEQDGQGANLFQFLDREGHLEYVPDASEACNDASLPGLSCPTRAWLSGGIGQYAKNRGHSVQGDLALTHFFDTKKAGAHQLKYGTQLEWLARRRVLQYSGENRDDFYDNCEPGQPGGGEWCFDPSTDRYALGQSGRVDNHRMIIADTDTPDVRNAIGFGRVQREQGSLRAIADSLGNGVRVSQYDATVSSTNLGAFVQDRWAVLSNLFLDVGLRWEGQQMRDVLNRPAVGIWDNVAPRASLVYDWTEEGRSRLFVSYGWFFQQLPVSLINRVHGGLVNVTRRYRNADCDAKTAAVRGVDEPLSAHGQPTEFCVDFGQSTTGLTEGATVPRLRGQYDQAVQLGYEQEIIEDLTLGVRWIHRDLGRAVEDVSTNGGLDFIIANPGVPVDPAEVAAQRRRCDDLDADLSGLNTDDPSRGEIARQLQRCNFLVDAYERVGQMYDRPTRTYDAFSFEVRKRYAENWLFIGSYTYSRLVGNYEGFVDPTTGAINLGSSVQYNMPELVRNSFGPLPYDTPHRLGLDGFYTFDLDEAGQLTLGGGLRVRSGYPVSMRAGHNRLPGVYPTHVLPRGAGGRVEPNYQLNATLQYAYPLTRGLAKSTDMALAVGLRFFNVTNAKATLRVDEVYTFQNTRPIAGGDLRDLKHAKVQSSTRPTEFFERRILDPQGNYAVDSAFQLPLTAQLDVTLMF